MNTKDFPKNVQQVVAAVLGRGTDTSTGQRKQVMNHAIALSTGQLPPSTLPSDWEPYIDTVIQQAYRVTDSHTERLLAAGHSEDEIFELTIAAALGAGIARLESGLSAMEAVTEK